MILPIPIPDILTYLLEFQKTCKARKTRKAHMAKILSIAGFQLNRGYQSVCNQLIEFFLPENFLQIAFHMLIYDAFRRQQTPLHLRFLSLNCPCKFCAQWIKLASSSIHDTIDPGWCRTSYPPYIQPTEDCHCFQFYYSSEHRSSFYQETWDDKIKD